MSEHEEETERGGRPAVGDRPTVTRDRRECSDPHDPPVPENVRRLRPAEVHNAPPGRRAPARDAADRHGREAPTAFDFATGKEHPPEARGARGPAVRALPPPRSSPPPSAPTPAAEPAGPRPSATPDPAAPARTVGFKGRAPRPQPGGPGAGGAASHGGAPPTAAPAEARRAPGAPRRLGVPVPVRVQSGAGGQPVRIEGDTVDAVRESWLIEDRWWTDRPLRRRYWEVVTTTGRDSIVFRDLVDGRWYRQR